MNKFIQKKSLWLVVSIIVVVGLVSIAQIGKAQVEKSKIAELNELAVTLNNADAFMAGMAYLVQGASEMFGASGSRYPNGISADTTSPSAGEVRGTTLTITGTTTLQEVALGSRYTDSLTFTAGATTTPGGLFSIQNTGARKVCDYIEVDVPTGSATGGRLGTGHPLTFNVSTSTSASAWSNDAGNLIASTTPATSTTPILNTRDNVGAVTNDSWEWNNGEYILGAFDSLSTDPATSSLVYTGMVGNAYIRCHTE